MSVATAIFLLIYVLVALGENSPRKLDRPTATLVGAVLMVATGVLTRGQAAAAIDMGTLALLFGLMVLLVVLSQSRLPTWIAARALNRCRSPQALLALVVFISGAASAIMLNDTVCLVGTPLLLEVTAQAGVSPAPFLLALATSSNIGSAMTLTGNPQNMIIANASGWGWSAFALRMVPIGLLCLAADWLLVAAIFRSSLRPRPLNRAIASAEAVEPKLAVKSVVVMAGLIAAFLLGVPMDVAALAAAAILLVALNRSPRETLSRVDWSLLLFFAGLFVVVQGFQDAEGGLLNRLEPLMSVAGAPLRPAAVARFSAATVFGSNLFSNVPFVLVARQWAARSGDPQFYWLLISLTSTFAGNLTLFGSVANLIVAQGARDRAPLRFRDFLKVGIPVTLVTTALGAGLLWLFRIWGWAP